MPISDNVKDYIKGVEYIVEATRFEMHALYDKWHNKVTWKEHLDGYLAYAGYIDGKSVCFSISADTINGKKILFWHDTSVIVDFDMITKWFDENLPGINKTDATNFSHAIL
jgi:hypothetical protein